MTNKMQPKQLRARAGTKTKTKGVAKEKKQSRPKPRTKPKVMDPSSIGVRTTLNTVPKVGITKATQIKNGGCRHCALSGLQTFNKAAAKWYMTSNRYLVGMKCKDCATPVNQMEPNRKGKTMLFYCDDGIKGYDAPEDDPMKGALTCDVVLCSACEEVRRIKVDRQHVGRHGRRPLCKRAG